MSLSGLPPLPPIPGQEQRIIPGSMADLERQQRDLVSTFETAHGVPGFLNRRLQGLVEMTQARPDDNLAETVFKGLGRFNLSMIEWVGDKWIRGEKAIISGLVTLPIGIPAGSERGKALQEQGFFKSVKMGLDNDPGAMDLGTLFIPDELGDKNIWLYRWHGLKLRHMRLVPSILFDPINRLGAPGVAIKVASRTKGNLTAVKGAVEGVRLTPEGQAVLKDVTGAVRGTGRMAAGAKGQTRRVRNQKLREIMTVWRRGAAYDPVTGTYKPGGGSEALVKNVKKVADPRTGKPKTVSDSLLNPAHRKNDLNDIERALWDGMDSIRKQDDLRIQRIMGRMIRNNPDLIYKRGWHLNTPTIGIPGKKPLIQGTSINIGADRIIQPLQDLWARNPATKGISSALDEITSPFSVMVGAVGRKTKKIAPWMPQVMSSARGIHSRWKREGDRWVKNTFKGVPASVQRDIIIYMQRRRTGFPDDVDTLLEKIPMEYRHLITEIEDMMAHAQSSANRMGYDLEEWGLYVPLRSRLTKEQSLILKEREMAAARRESLEEMGGRLDFAPPIDEGVVTFRRNRQFNTFEEVLDHWDEIGVPWAKEARENPDAFFILQADELMQRRLYEQAKLAGERHVMHNVEKRVGFRDQDAKAWIALQNLPELARNWMQFDRFTRYGVLSSESLARVGEAIELDDIIKAEKATGKNVGQRTGRLDRMVQNMSEDERAHFLETAIRRAGDSENPLAEFRDLLIDKAMWFKWTSPEAYNRMRKELDVNIEDLKNPFGENYEVLTGLKINKELNGLWLPRDMIRELQGVEKVAFEAPESLKNALKINDWMMGRYKVGSTIMWASFHARNRYSDFAQAFTMIGIAAANPLRALKIMKTVAGQPGWTDVGGIKMPFDIARREWEDLHVYVNPGEVLDIVAQDGMVTKTIGGEGFFGRIAKGGDTKLTRALSKAGRGIRSALDIENKRFIPTGFLPKEMRFRAFTEGEKGKIFGKEIEAATLADLSAVSENFGRLFLYDHYRGQGIAPELAAAYVNKVFFDYGALSETEKEVFRRVFPFWTWQKNNIALQMHFLATQPGRLGAQLKLTMQDYGPDEAFLPEYAMGEMKLGVRQDEQGKMKFLTGIDLPIQGLFDLALNKDFGKLLQNWVGMAGPFPKNWLEAYAFKRDAFTGKTFNPGERTRLKSLWGKGLAEVLNAVPGLSNEYFLRKDYDPTTGETYTTVDAAKWHVWVKGMMLSRLTSTAERFERYVDDEGLFSTTAMLDFLGGFRYEEYDLTDRQRALVTRNIKWLEDEGRKAGIIYDFTLQGKSRRERR